jgi:hypothetical protein
LDESILSGESNRSSAARRDVRSGSFALEGTAAFEVTVARRDSYAERLAGEAREFRHRARRSRSRSTGCCSCSSGCWRRSLIFGYAVERDTPTPRGDRRVVAGGVTLIPEGLILLGVTYAVAALRMARRGVAQQLNAVGRWRRWR